MGIFVHIWKHIRSMARDGDGERALITISNLQLHFQSNNRNTRTRYKICSKLTIKTPERRQPQ